MSAAGIPYSSGLRLKPGSFVQYDSEPFVKPVGYVSDFSSEELHVRHFENGLPEDTYLEPPFEQSIALLTLDLAIDHFRELSEQFRKRTQLGGLTGGIASRRKHVVDSVVNLLTKEPDMDPRRVDTFLWEPDSCTYVVEGVYENGGREVCLEGFKVPHTRLKWFKSIGGAKTEENIAEMLKFEKPNGFGRIKNETEYGVLVGYNAFRVPIEYDSFGEKLRIWKMSL